MEKRSGMQMFGELIKQERERQRMQSKELATKVGLGTSTMSEIETGDRKTPPSPELIDSFHKTLGIPKQLMLQKLGYLDESDDAVTETAAEARLRPLLQRIGDNEVLLNYVEESLRRDIRFYTSIQRGEREITRASDPKGDNE